jgi:hypothetical protein
MDEQIEQILEIFDEMNDISSSFHNNDNQNDSRIAMEITTSIEELEDLITDNIRHNREDVNESTLNEMFRVILMKIDYLSNDNYNQELKNDLKRRIEICKTNLIRIYNSNQPVRQPRREPRREPAFRFPYYYDNNSEDEDEDEDEYEYEIQPQPKTFYEGLKPGPAPSAGGRNKKTKKSRKPRKTKKSRKTRKTKKSRKSKN